MKSLLVTLKALFVPKHLISFSRCSEKLHRSTGHAKITNYNMVGVAVAMEISTMHEKSCIDSHSAWKFEKSSKIQSFTHLAITMMKLRKYHSYEFLKVS